MTKVFWGWKAAAPVLCMIAAVDFGMQFIKSSMNLGACASSLGLIVASAAALQYGFCWPKIDRRIWRMFCPVFSLMMIWSLSSVVGWLGTRLAVIQLSTPQIASTFTMLVLVLLYGYLVITPVYRLADWRAAAQQRQQRELAELSDTFA